MPHHHIFDPATGDSPTGLEADGLSTAFMVMGARTRWRPTCRASTCSPSARMAGSGCRPGVPAA
jgi:hypothetical protein